MKCRICALAVCCWVLVAEDTRSQNSFSSQSPDGVAHKTPIKDLWSVGATFGVMVEVEKADQSIFASADLSEGLKTGMLPGDHTTINIVRRVNAQTIKLGVGSKVQLSINQTASGNEARLLWGHPGSTVVLQPGASVIWKKSELTSSGKTAVTFKIGRQGSDAVISSVAGGTLAFSRVTAIGEKVSGILSQTDQGVIETSDPAPAQTKTKEERRDEAIQLLRSTPDQAGQASKRLAELAEGEDFGVRCQAAFTTVLLGQRLAEKLRSPELEQSLSSMILAELQTKGKAVPTDAEITEGRGVVWTVKRGAPAITTDSTIRQGQHRKNALFMGPCLYSGIQALGEIRARSKEAFDLLSTLLQSKDKTVGSAAAYAMPTLDRATADRTKVLQETQNTDADEEVKGFIQGSLGLLQQATTQSREQP